ncbi:MAG: DUF1844 domain-containing protein, partial [Planctomycetia bacterium]|nr:DUF1844 domain-containing protein [Planctomycetia bacterium]
APSDDASRDAHAPSASFEFLVHTLFTQALMALGRIPNPITKQTMKNVAAARHFIEMLGVLEEKTAGNLSADERRLLDEVQHQLRMQLLQESGQPRVEHPGSASS